MSRLEDIEKSIRKYTSEVVTEKIYNKKLKRDVLVVLLFGGAGIKVRVFDETRGLNEVGTIIYSIIGERVSVSSFVVNEDFQNKGIGRSIFELCMAHADAENVEYLHGDINPTDPIKGVSKEDVTDLEAEIKALIKIYKKLDCKVKKVKVGNVEKLIFEQTWKHGEKLNSVDDQRKKMIEHVVKNRNKIREK